MFNRDKIKQYGAYKVNLIFPHDFNLKSGSKKDIWDKFSAVSTMFSGLLIAGIGLYFSHIYQDQKSLEQIRVAKVEVVQKLLPYILETEATKANALVTIAELGSTSLSIRLAMLNPGSGAAKALAEILSEESERLEKRLEQKALSGLKNMLASPAQSIVSMQYKEKTLYGFRMSDKGYFVFKAPSDFDLENVGSNYVLSDDGLQVRAYSASCCSVSGRTQLFHVKPLKGSPKSTLNGLLPANSNTLSIGDTVWFEPYSKEQPSAIGQVQSISNNVIKIKLLYTKKVSVSAGALLDMQGLLVGFKFENDGPNNFVPF